MESSWAEPVIPEYNPNMPRKAHTEPMVAVTWQIPERQKEALDFLHEALEGRPPVAGLVRHAIQQYLDLKFATPELNRAFAARRERAIKLLRS